MNAIVKGSLVIRSPSASVELANNWEKHCKHAGLNPFTNFIVTGIGNGGKSVELGELGFWGIDNFILADSKSNGVKYDSDKPRVDLLIDGCPLSLEAISQVLTFGSKKYADHNWQHVEGGEQRYKAALMRHVLASAKGEKVDSETGLSHLAHAACCVLFMLELELKKDA